MGFRSADTWHSGMHWLQRSQGQSWSVTRSEQRDGWRVIDVAWRKVNDRCKSRREAESVFCCVQESDRPEAGLPLQLTAKISWTVVAGGSR